MPTVLIEVRRHWSPAEEEGIIDAVHGALVDAFRIPPQDRHVRLLAHEPHRFACPPGQERPEFATLVTVDCFAGRSVGAKRRLYAGIVERLVPFGIPPGAVLVTLRESATESWGIAGGRAACDVELGFDVEV